MVGEKNPLAHVIMCRENMMPALYVVATPIGNLEDITPRAVRILKEVKLIAAEDTRKTRILLSAYAIKTPTTSYFEHNKLTKLDYILSVLEQNDVALVSDAGMPGISDPGYELISAAIRQNTQVIPIPGPSVLISALVVSGLPTDSFCYLGFLPHKSGDRRRLLQNIAAAKSTLIFFESPHRLIRSLEDILEVLGDRQCAVCRELTKIHEEVFRSRISAAIQHFLNPRGEFTLVIAGCADSARPVINQTIEENIRQLQSTGSTAKEAIRQIAGQTGLTRKKLYQTWLKTKKE